jgi:hypothetical protein
MERKSMELKSFKYYNEDDYIQEYDAYIKTKKFMASRIAEQQSEIDSLKEKLKQQTIKHASLYEILIDLNEKLKEANIKSGLPSDDDKINLSGDLVNSIILEENSQKSQDGAILNAESAAEQKKLIDEMAKENLELRTQLEYANYEIHEKSNKISLLAYDKYILFSELNNLLKDLERADIDKLNSFLINQIKSKQSNSFQNDILTSIGIKYNIINAQNQLMLLTHPDSVETQKMRNTVNYGFNNLYRIDDVPYNKTINIRKYNGVIKHYEDEFANCKLENTIYKENRFSSLETDTTKRENFETANSNDV